MLPPIRRLRNQRRRPAIRKWDLQSVRQTRSHRRRYAFQIQTLPEAVNHITQSTQQSVSQSQTTDTNTNIPLPSHPLHNPKRNPIQNPRIQLCAIQVRQRMRKRPRATPRHSKHKMQRHAQRLRTMHMRKRRRIRNNSISHERAPIHCTRLNATPPTPLQHLRNHLPLLLDVACAQRLHARDEPRVLHHVGHEIVRVAADREELDVRGFDEGAEAGVCCDAQAVAVGLQFLG